MSYKIFCILRGGRPAFSVKIDKTETVDDLKEAIKTKVTQALDGVEANALTLYQVNIDASDMEKAIVEAEIRFQGLKNLTRLSEAKTLEGVIGSSPPPIERIHILVQAPGSKSIYCRGVAEAMLICTDYPSNDSGNNRHYRSQAKTIRLDRSGGYPRTPLLLETTRNASL